MAKKGMNIYKRKDGRWEGRYIKGHTENGKLIFGYLYAKTYTEVKSKLNSVIITLPQAPSENKHLTFSAAASQWLYNASVRVKPSTYANYYSMLENHILPVIGDYRLQMLSDTVIDQFVKSKLNNGRKDGRGGLSPKTVRDMLSIIKSTFDYVQNKNMVVVDLKITYPKNSKQIMRVLSKQEQSALEQVLADRPDIYKMAILLCLYTGLRIGEVCALRWKDIALDRGVISVKQTMQRIRNISPVTGKRTRVVIDIPKTTCSIREIPLPVSLRAFFSCLAADNEAFFLSSAGTDYTEPRTLQNYFKRYVKAAGIAPANFHSTRHTFASRCIEAGMDVKSLSEILGHSSINITLDRYVHSSFEQKQDGIKKLEQLMNINIASRQNSRQDRLK